METQLLKVHLLPHLIGIVQRVEVNLLLRTLIPVLALLLEVEADVDQQLHSQQLQQPQRQIQHRPISSNISQRQ